MSDGETSTGSRVIQKIRGGARHDDLETRFPASIESTHVPIGALIPRSWCPRGDLNPHALAGTSTSS